MRQEDSQLLSDFVETGNEHAFESIVSRYSGMVYGCAFRRTGDPQMAEEVSQNVFAALARKARMIRRLTTLGPWLHRAAVLESKAAYRKETRHRRKVRALREAEAKGTSEPEKCMINSDPSSDFLPELDRALDALPTADRQVVLLRFVEDRSYGEVGGAAGRTEEADRKRVARALEKLSGVLRRRGVVLSTAALTSAMAAEFGKAAPATVSAGLAQSSLAAAVGTSAGGSTGTLTILQTMAYSKIGAMAAIVIVSVLCAGGGYVAGKERERKRQQADLALLTPGLNSVPAVVDGVSPGELGSRAGAVDRDVRQILDAAATHFRKSAEDSEEYRRGMLAMAELRGGDLGETIRYVEALKNEAGVHDAMLAVAMDLWARNDPAAAAEYANANLTGALATRAFGDLALEWARQDAEEAFAWFREKGIPQSVSERHVRGRLYRGWAETDAEAALDSLAQLSLHEATDVCRHLAESVGANLNRSNIMRAIADIEHHKVRATAIVFAAGRWARDEPAEAATWFDEHATFDGDEARAHAAAEVAEDWIQEDPRAAMDWIWPKIEHLQEERTDLLRKWVKDWHARDPEAAADWMETAAVSPNELGNH